MDLIKSFKSFFNINSEPTIIKVWDYLKEYNQEKKEILSAIEEVLDSGWLILGSKVKNFEEQYAAFCEAKHGIGVANGTDAIF